MDLFKCTEDELAKYLTIDPRIYNNAIRFFDGLKNKNALNSELEESLQDNLDFLERANTIARNADYYIFEVEDTWTKTDGLEVFKMVDTNLISVLGLTTEGSRLDEEVEGFLKENKVTKIYSASVPSEGYYGVKSSCDESDNHEIIYGVFEPGFHSIGDIEAIILED